MDNTAIQAGTPPSVAGRATAIQAEALLAPRPRHAPKSVAWRALETVASLKITVTLFALSLVLVFYGTLAQTELGIGTVVDRYFRSPFVLIPLDIVCIVKPVLRWDTHIPGYLPYPGGWLLGACLLVNLLAAHIVSFKLSWRRSGIVVLHAGIVVMMLGELITGLCAVESNMQIDEHGSSNYTFQHAYPEFAVVDSSDLNEDHVTVVPTALLKRGGTIADEQLPFDVVIDEYMVNSALQNLAEQEKSLATQGQGLHFKVVPRAEGAGVDRDQKVDLASMIATLRHRGTGDLIGTYIFTTHLLKPDWIKVDGKTYQVSLRFKRTYRDYTFRLDKLNIAYYPNTNKPKDYSSFIHLTDAKRHEERDVRIYMNNPLSYQGETFYQASVGEEMGRRSTTLQVVSNPGWLMPYLSCFMVAAGMLFHFGQNLYRFVERTALRA